MGPISVPTEKGIVFGHHFTSIAGTGPIVGPCTCGDLGLGPRTALGDFRLNLDWRGSRFWRVSCFSSKQGANGRGHSWTGHYKAYTHIVFGSPFFGPNDCPSDFRPCHR